MYVRLAFAVAAHLEPEILIVDEVLAVGDTQFQKKCLGKMEDVSKLGRTVIFVSHNLPAVKLLCNNGILLDKGLLAIATDIETTIDEYLRRNSSHLSSSSNSKLPIKNSEYEIVMTKCNVEITDNLSLVISITLESLKHNRNIGIGVSIYTSAGVLVSLLAPAITNFVIEDFKGTKTCIFKCDEVSKYLNGGSYTINVWASKPKIECLIMAEKVATFVIQGEDLYSTGCLLEESKHGLVPLPTEFRIEG